MDEVKRGELYYADLSPVVGANRAVSDLSSFYRTIKQIKTVQPQL